MRRRLSRSDRPGERGVVLILVAFAMTAVLIIAALVLDIGNVRNTRQSNKSAADFATTAGLQGMQHDDGVPRPWAGACAALEYLEANAPSLSLDVEFTDGHGDPILVTDPCTLTTFLDLKCGSDPGTWAWIHGEDGQFTVDIKSAYVTPDADFDEDATIYAGDDGGHAGCDQIAVIINDVDDEFFGSIAGADEYETRIRSVGRVDIDEFEPVSVALVLLEQKDCRALDFIGGGSAGEIRVRGTDDRPGIVHSDSDGTGHQCSTGNEVVEGENKAGIPLVRALSAPADASIHGIGSTYAMFNGGTNGMSWTPARSDPATEVWMCDEDDGDAVATCPAAPVGNDRVTRRPADDRYLDELTTLRSEVNAVFDQIDADDGPAGYTSYTSLGFGCTLQGPGATHTVLASQVPGGKLFVDCDALDIKNNHNLVIEPGITDVVFKGQIVLAGDGSLDIRDPRRVLVHNRTGQDDAVASSGNFRINGDGFSTCEQRQVAPNENEVTELVVRRGAFQVTGNGTIRMCATFLHLMGGQVGAAPVNTGGTYPAPYPNTSNDGTFDVGGGGSVEWTAPNTVVGGLPSSGDYRFEDLAVWTESSNDSTLSGGGVMTLAGVFVLGNAGPETTTGGLVIGGTPGGLINLDAQVWTRKLAHNGNARLIMRANPEDSIPVPFFASAALVR